MSNAARKVNPAETAIVPAGEFHAATEPTLTPDEACAVLQVSLSTLDRRRKAGLVPFVIGPRGHVRYPADIAEKVRVGLRIRPPLQSKDDLEGDQAKTLFPYFRSSTPLDEVVEKTAISPDVVLKLHEKWLLLRERSRNWLGNGK